MTSKEIKKLIELVEAETRAGVTAEKAMQDLVGAGILDANGNYTPPFQELLDECNSPD